MKRGFLETIASTAACMVIAVEYFTEGLDFISLFAVPIIGIVSISYFLFQKNVNKIVQYAEKRITNPDLLVPQTGTLLGAKIGKLVAFLDIKSKNTKAAADNLNTVMTRSDIALNDLEDNLVKEIETANLTSEAIREMSFMLRDIASHVETLATSAEESSSSILEMTATNEEVAENIVSMGVSVRETANSIEEMAHSAKDVASSIDALSTTAEETSSAMNQMDVSIDQVRSNATETARMSEDVSDDAERAANAISSTIHVIKEIKSSSQEAVDVIFNLGQKIDAIGQILSVIDDVAEQTNLLALNAAIIAAQAGEHGKGFAVVADEIKDLAERSGVSTKEIANLIRVIQAESKNAIDAVERGNSSVDKGVDVSDNAEKVLRKILLSAQKSTDMMHSIARATVEQSKGSKQVTDTISRIAQTVQKIAKATSEQAHGAELIINSADKMRSITQHVERSTQEQAKGGRQITNAIESISKMVNQLNLAHHQQQKDTKNILELSSKVEMISRKKEKNINSVKLAFESIQMAIAINK